MLPLSSVETVSLCEGSMIVMQEDMEALCAQLVSGMLVRWHAEAEHPEALIRSSLGEAGELESETKVHPPSLPPTQTRETPSTILCSRMGYRRQPCSS